MKKDAKETYNYNILILILTIFIYLFIIELHIQGHIFQENPIRYRGSHSP